MKAILLPIPELRSALLGLAKVIDLKASSPLLQHVKVERTADGWIALTGTNNQQFITVRLEHPAEGRAMAVLVPFDQLQQLTKSSGKDESLIITNTPQGPVIKFDLTGKAGESKVKLVPVDQFPATPRVKADSIPLPSELRQSIREALNCSSTDDSRKVLNGVFIDVRNPKASYIVGTDGKHLYSANSFTLPLKHSVLIPNHKFLKWTEFNRDGEWQLKSGDQFVQICSRRWRFISKQIEGKYPEWRQSIPSPTAARTHITLDPAKLETIIRLVLRMPCHDEKFCSIGLEWRGGQFLLLGKDKADEPWTKVPVSDVKGTGPEVQTFMDRRLLIKALEYGLNTISLISSFNPIRAHAQGKQMIMMPLRINT